MGWRQPYLQWRGNHTPPLRKGFLFNVKPSWKDGVSHPAISMNKSIEADRETGKGLGPSALNALLPDLKKAEETAWLADCYSQILQATTLNLTTAYKNLLF